MTPFERPPGAGVIESFRRAALPVHHRKLAAGVLGMTAGAALRRDGGGSAHTAVPLNEPRNLFMTVEAQPRHLLLLSTTAAPVAFHALERPVEIRIPAREWAR